MSALGKTDQALMPLAIFALRRMHASEEASGHRRVCDGRIAFAAIVKIACPRATMPLRER